MAQTGRTEGSGNMSEDFNYGAAELSKLDDHADRYAVKIEGRYDDGTDGGATRWMSLTREQFSQVESLIAGFNL